MPDRPVVSVDPAVRFGRPNMRGISTDTLADLYWAGETAETICDEYGLTRRDLAVALWFEGTHGRRRKAWKTWADGVAYPRLAGWKKPLDIDLLPLPPDRNGEPG